MLEFEEQTVMSNQHFLATKFLYFADNYLNVISMAQNSQLLLFHSIIKA